GYGDFKLNAAVGAFLGWKMLLLVIILSSLLGIVFGVAQMIAKKGGWQAYFQFHFGPYLAMAGIVGLFLGPQLNRQEFNMLMLSPTPSDSRAGSAAARARWRICSLGSASTWSTPTRSRTS